MQLAQDQQEAMDAIVKWYGGPEKEFYIAGYAGTGKTTITNEAIRRIKDKYRIQKVITAAYTGKAASVLQKKGIANAQTIHSLLYIPLTDTDGNLCFVKRLDSEGYYADLIVLDECSMIGEEIAKDIRELGKKILVIGDPGQLPPIEGGGGFTNRPPDAFLKQIHRQAEGSPILELATMARQGIKLPIGYDKDGVRVMPLTIESKKAMLNPDTQVICGTHLTRYNYTQEIRRARGIESKRPVKGEKIICCRTNYRYGFYNGYMGVLNGLRTVNNEVVDPLTNTVSMQEKCYASFSLDDVSAPKTNILIDPYLFDNHFHGGKLQALDDNKANYGLYSELDWAYLITCHKAQGSQFDDVTVIDDSGSFGTNKDRWLYTALTRAVTKLTVLTRHYR